MPGSPTPCRCPPVVPRFCLVRRRRPCGRSGPTGGVDGHLQSSGRPRHRPGPARPHRLRDRVFVPRPRDRRFERDALLVLVGSPRLERSVRRPHRLRGRAWNRRGRRVDERRDRGRGRPRLGRRPARALHRLPVSRPGHERRRSLRMVQRRHGAHRACGAHRAEGDDALRHFYSAHLERKRGRGNRLPTRPHARGIRRLGQGDRSRRHHPFARRHRAASRDRVHLPRADRDPRRALGVVGKRHGLHAARAARRSERP